MKTLIITTVVMLGLASCSNVSSKNSQVVNEVSYTHIRNDTIFDFENETIGKLPFGFIADATGKAESIKWSVVNDNGNIVVAQQSINSGSSYNLLVLDKIGFKDFIPNDDSLATYNRVPTFTEALKFRMFLIKRCFTLV